jgi:hypothetical protein
LAQLESSLSGAVDRMDISIVFEENAKALGSFRFGCNMQRRLLAAVSSLNIGTF